MVLPQHARADLSACDHVSTRRYGVQVTSAPPDCEVKVGPVAVTFEPEMSRLSAGAAASLSIAAI